MTDTKIGLSQINKPAPLYFRRFVNATILFFIPAAIGVVQGLTMSDEIRNVLMIIISAVPPMLKGFAVMMGDEQHYSPSNETMEKK